MARRKTKALKIIAKKKSLIAVILVGLWPRCVSSKGCYSAEPQNKCALLAGRHSEVVPSLSLQALCLAEPPLCCQGGLHTVQYCCATLSSRDGASVQCRGQTVFRGERSSTECFMTLYSAADEPRFCVLYRQSRSEYSHDHVTCV